MKMKESSLKVIVKENFGMVKIFNIAICICRHNSPTFTLAKSLC